MWLLLFAPVMFGEIANAQATPPQNPPPQTPIPTQPSPTAPQPAAPTQAAPKQPAAKPLPKNHAFLQVRDSQLYLGKMPFRNIGVNIPDLFERFLNGNDASATQSLDSAQAAGVRCVRCFGTTWGPENFGIFASDPNRWFRAYDRMLAAADQDGIAVIPSLLFNIHMLPDYVRRTTGKDEQVVDYLTPGSASNNLAVAYVTAVVSRYKNDPRILLWEIGNEYNLEADLSAQWKARPANQIPTSDQVRAFLIQIATLIKRLDKKHPVVSGNADMRPASWHMRQALLAHRSGKNPLDYPMDWTKDSFPQYVEILDFFNPPPLDLLSVHRYPPTDDDVPFWMVKNTDYAFIVPWEAVAADRIGKPLFVGEFGQKVVTGQESGARWLLDFFKRIGIMQSAPVGLIWAWDFHNGDPAQDEFSLTPERTPQIVRALADMNHLILAEVIHASQDRDTSPLVEALPASPPPQKKPAK